MQKLWKSVKIWQSYREFKGGPFFETQCRKLQLLHDLCLSEKSYAIIRKAENIVRRNIFMRYGRIRQNPFTARAWYGLIFVGKHSWRTDSVSVYRHTEELTDRSLTWLLAVCDGESRVTVAGFLLWERAHYPWRCYWRHVLHHQQGRSSFHSQIFWFLSSCLYSVNVNLLVFCYRLSVENSYSVCC